MIHSNYLFDDVHVSRIDRIPLRTDINVIKRRYLLVYWVVEWSRNHVTLVQREILLFINQFVRAKYIPESSFLFFDRVQLFYFFGAVS